MRPVGLSESVLSVLSEKKLLMVGQAKRPCDSNSAVSRLLLPVLHRVEGDEFTGEHYN